MVQKLQIDNHRCLYNAELQHRKLTNDSSVCLSTRIQPNSQTLTRHARLRLFKFHVQRFNIPNRQLENLQRTKDTFYFSKTD